METSDKIYVVDADETLHALSRSTYASEDLLQTLLERYPDLLAGEQMGGDEPRQWALVSREVGVPGEDGGSNRWSLDHLFLDQDGVPTLVEVKRSTDTRIRREVVGQMLDYAANAVVYWPVDRLVTAFEATCDAEGTDPVECIVALTGASPDDADAWDAYWQAVKTNLQAGRVRMVFLADIIPPELRRIVEFLNGQMDPAEVLAVEVRHYVGGGLRTLVPRVVGQTAQSEQKKSGTPHERRQWDAASLFAALDASRGSGERAVAEALLQWAEGHRLRVWWGRGRQSGSFIPVLDHPDGGHSVFAVYSYGTVELYFQHWHAPFNSDERKRQLLDEFEGIPGLTLSHRNLQGRPRVDLAQLQDPERRRLFLGVLDRMIAELKTLHGMA